MQLAKAVASAAAALVLKAKNVAQKTEDSALQTQVIAAATQCALSTSQLVACTKVRAGPGARWLNPSLPIQLASPAPRPAWSIQCWQAGTGRKVTAAYSAGLLRAPSWGSPGSCSMICFQGQFMVVS